MSVPAKKLPKLAISTAALRAIAKLTVRPIMLLPEGDEPPTEFRVFAVGINETEKGPFLWDDVAAQTCMAFWGNKGIDLSMDWEHQALSDPPIQAPASCWWVPEIRNGELWATQCRWTDDAATQLRKKEYRYFSPAFEFDGATLRPTRIINVALTNLPAMDRIDPLMAASTTAPDTAKEKQMEELAALKAQLTTLTAQYDEMKKQLASKTEECASLTLKLSAMADEDKEECRSVGLRFDASRTDRRTTIAALTANLAKVRELTGQTTDAQAVATLSVMKADAAEAVALRARVAEAEEREIASESKAIYQDGELAGKVPPAADHPIRKMLDGGFSAVRKGDGAKAAIAWLRSSVAGLSVIAPGASGSGTGGGGSNGARPGVLTEQQKKIAKMAGMPIKQREELERQRIEAGGT